MPAALLLGGVDEGGLALLLQRVGGGLAGGLGLGLDHGAPCGIKGCEFGAYLTQNWALGKAKKGRCPTLPGQPDLDPFSFPILKFAFVLIQPFLAFDSTFEAAKNRIFANHRSPIRDTDDK